MPAQPPSGLFGRQASFQAQPTLASRTSTTRDRGSTLTGGGRSASPSKSPRASANATDRVSLSVVPDVDIRIETSFANEAPGTPSTPGKPKLPPLFTTGRYTIVGPPTVHQHLPPTDAASPHMGSLSPIARVTLPPEAKAQAGIPLEATCFAFVHPLPKFEGSLKKLNMARHTWGFVLLVGGFVYLDDDHNVLQVNALTFAKTANALSLAGPYAPSAKALDALRAQRRMQPLAVGALAEAGMKALGWVHPAELFTGTSLSDGTRNEHGSFVYEWQASAAAPMVYSVFPPGEDGGRELEKTFKPGEDAAATMPLTIALRALSEQSERAEATKRAAAGILRKQPTGNLEEEDSIIVDGEPTALSKLRGPEVKKLLKVLLVRALAVVIYLAVGIAFYANIERHSCTDVVDFGSGAYSDAAACDDELWTPIDAFYFVTVTMSTVGYGDLYPSTPGARLFTSVYILVGVAVVFNFAGKSYNWVITFLERKIGRCCLRFYSLRGLPNYEGKDAALPPPAWRFYVEHIGFYFLTGAVFNLLLSALVFTRLQEGLVDDDGAALDDYGFALWHCWVTATTVGYGDYTLATQNVRFFAACHVILSVSWLAGLIRHTQDKREKYALEVLRCKMIRRQLSEDLIENFDFRKDGLVSRVEFVVGMLATLGATLCGESLKWDSDVKPLLDRFDAMDVDGSGTLEVADLAWMFVQARENHQPPPPERDEEQFQRKSFFFPMKAAGPLLKAASFKKSKVAPGA